MAILLEQYAEAEASFYVARDCPNPQKSHHDYERKLAQGYRQPSVILVWDGLGGVDGECEEEEVVVHTRSITNTQTCY
jgi:hypothetical protein